MRHLKTQTNCDANIKLIMTQVLMKFHFLLLRVNFYSLFQENNIK